MRQPTASTVARVVLVMTLVAAAGIRADAAPIRYEFHQTGSSRPNTYISGWIEIDGTFADLPVTDCWVSNHNRTGECPPNVWPLLGFEFRPPSVAVVTLADYLNEVSTDSGEGRFISGPGFVEVHRFIVDDLILTLGGPEGSIYYGTDQDSPCQQIGGCFFYGSWVPVPEPGTLALTAFGLIAAARLRRSRSCRPHA